MATWAKGIDFKNNDNTTRIGGIGMFGTDTTSEKLYLGLGAEPWNNGLEITNDLLNFNNKKIYHEGNKPMPSDIGAAALSHSHNYINSIGNANPQTGRIQDLGNLYTYNTTSENSGGPTTYSSVIGFGRSTLGTVEICGEYTGEKGLWFRALRDTIDDWYGWTRIYTEAYKPHTYGTGNPNNNDGMPDGSVYYKYA